RTLSVQVDAIMDRVRETFGRFIPGFWNGGIVDTPTLATVGERGAEAIFPLTNPSRMRSLMGLPQVAAAFEAAGIGQSSVQAGNYAPVTVDQSQVNNFEITEAVQPRRTASEIIRSQRKARFHG